MHQRHTPSSTAGFAPRRRLPFMQEAFPPDIGSLAPRAPRLQEGRPSPEPALGRRSHSRVGGVQGIDRSQGDEAASSSGRGGGVERAPDPVAGMRNVRVRSPSPPPRGPKRHEPSALDARARFAQAGEAKECFSCLLTCCRCNSRHNRHAGALARLQTQDDASTNRRHAGSKMAVTSRFFFPFGHLPRVQSLFLYRCLMEVSS